MRRRREILAWQYLILEISKSNSVALAAHIFEVGKQLGVGGEGRERERERERKRERERESSPCNEFLMPLPTSRLAGCKKGRPTWKHILFYNCRKRKRRNILPA